MNSRRWTAVLAAASVTLLLGAHGLLGQATGNPHGPPPGPGPHHGPPAVPPGLHDRTPPPGKPFGGEPGVPPGRGEVAPLGKAATAQVAAAARQVSAALAAGSLRPEGAAAPPAEAQRTVRGLLAGGDRPAAARVRAALLSRQNEDAGPEADRLVTSAAGLLSDPGRLPAAVRAQNALVRASSRSFLADPPPEFLALHAALAELVAAAGTKAGDGTGHR